jgi:CHASE3 domain sensor protein
MSTASGITDVTAGKRINLAFLTLSLCVAGAGILGSARISHLGQVVEKMVAAGSDTSTRAELQVVMIEESLAEKNYVLSKDQRLIDEHEKFQKEVEATLKDAQRVSEKEERYDKVGTLTEILSQQETQETIFHQIVGLVRSGKAPQAVALSSTKSDDQLNQSLQGLWELMDDDRQAYERDAQECASDAQGATRFIMASTAVCVLLAVLMGAVLNWRARRERTAR